MKLMLGTLLLLPSLVMAQEGTDLLLKNSKENLTSPIIQVQKQIKLDDPFLIQFYGLWKAARIHDEDFTAWVDLLLEKKNIEAYRASYQVKINSKEKAQLVDASRLYLLWNLGLNQTYFNEWLKLSADKDFFSSPFAHLIDQLTGPKASEWLVGNGIYITQAQREKLVKIKNLQSLFNNSAQAYFNLRSGIAGMDYIKRLPVSDKLRLKLGDSLILGYARKNELAKSAKLLKEIYEPILAKENDVEKLSTYYMLLARLLYQARAFEAAEHYYSLIPAESSKFLNARVEKLWIDMRKEDLASLKGDLKTLTMHIFEDKFLPEVHLVSAMANLKLCQFKAVEKNFADYIRIQNKFAAEIEQNLSSKEPRIIDQNDFYLKQLILSESKLATEKGLLEGYKDENLRSQISMIEDISQSVKLDKVKETQRKWTNRKKMLEASIRKMRFVKVEFLSLMRRLNSALAEVKTSDKVQLKSSALAKDNQLVFPYDGVTFGDELFHYESNLKNLCLRGNR